MHEIVNRYDVADRANRFLVGHYMEAVLASAFYAVDIVAPPAGSTADGFDLHGLTSHFGDVFSVKSSFSTSASDFRISNGMGGAGRGWTDPTLFLNPKLKGIVYADPVRFPDLAVQVKSQGDSTALALSAIRAHALANPDCMIAVDVPTNPKTGRNYPGMDVFRQIIGDAPSMYPRLSRVLVRARVASEGGDLMEQMEQILGWEREGKISPTQREGMIDRLLGR